MLTPCGTPSSSHGTPVARVGSPSSTPQPNMVTGGDGDSEPLDKKLRIDGQDVAKIPCNRSELFLVDCELSRDSDATTVSNCDDTAVVHNTDISSSNDNTAAVHGIHISSSSDDTAAVHGPDISSSIDDIAVINNKDISSSNDDASVVNSTAASSSKDDSALVKSVNVSSNNDDIALVNNMDILSNNDDTACVKADNTDVSSSNDVISVDSKDLDSENGYLQVSYLCAL